MRRASIELGKESLAAGFNTSKVWDMTYPKIQILTIDQLLNGKQPQLPPRYSTFQKSSTGKGEKHSARSWGYRYSNDRQHTTRKCPPAKEKKAYSSASRKTYHL